MKILTVKPVKDGYDVSINLKSFLSADAAKFLSLIEEPIEYTQLLEKFRGVFKTNEDDTTQLFIDTMFELKFFYLIDERYGKNEKIRLTDIGKNVLKIIKKS